jgi:hypothetical protein
MDITARRKELEELEHSVLRSDHLLFVQSQVIVDLERSGHEATARSAKSLLRAFESARKKQIARRDWLRAKLGWYAQRGGGSPL